MKHLIRKISLLATMPLLLSGCNKGLVSQDSYDNMYDHLVYCWNQSLQGSHFDNAFYGDSRVIGADFVGAFNDKSVVNLGVGGDRISNLIDRFELIKTVSPKRVFLAIGGNDVLSGKYQEDTFKTEYSALLNMFKENGCDVIIHNVVGLTCANSSLNVSDVNKKNDKIAEANEVIKSCAATYNYTLVDIAAVMNKEGTNEMNPEYSLDGVHFNEKGNAVWFDTIRSLVI